MAIVQKKKANKDTAEKAAKPSKDALHAEEEKRRFKHLTEEEEHRISVLIRNHYTTEKTTMYQTKGVYTFIVAPKATKFAIKRAVEKAYRVHVADVRTVTIPRKHRMRGRLEGWKAGHKKALVTVAEGEKIELM